jgi:hypothetical protein
VIKNRHYYARGPIGLLKEQPAHCTVVLLQFGTLGAQATLGLAQLGPAAFMAAQAGLGAVQVALLHLQEYKHTVKGGKDRDCVHPLAGLQLALDALRLKAARARGQVTEDELSSVIKLQSAQRGKLARQQTQRIAQEKLNKASKVHEK